MERVNAHNNNHKTKSITLTKVSLNLYMVCYSHTWLPLSAKFTPLLLNNYKILGIKHKNRIKIKKQQILILNIYRMFQSVPKIGSPENI